MKQGVALTGRNTTGPPCSVGHPTARVTTRSVTDDDDDRRQKAKQYWPIRRASNRCKESEELLVGMNGRQNKDADDNVKCGVGKRQLTSLVTDITDKRVTA